MKVRNWLASLLAVAGMALCATSANATTTWTSIGSNNGVTCYEASGGTYPEDNHFVYCGTDTITRDALVQTVKDANASYTTVQNAIEGRGVTIGIFNTAEDFFKFNAVGTPTSTDLQNFYNSALNETGRSTPIGPSTFAYERKNNATYSTVPNTVALTLDEMKASLLHELGHQFDYAKGNISLNAGFTAAAEKDQRYMEANAVSPSAAALRITYDYFLVRDPSPNGYAELFAQEFENFMITNVSALSGISHLPVDGDALTPYFKCSSLFVEKEIVSDREPNLTEYGTTGCTVTCTTYNDGSPTGAFPADSAGHMQVCYAATSQDKANTAASVRDLNHATNAAWDKVRTSGLIVYMFANQDEAAEYIGMNDTYSTSLNYYEAAAFGQCGFAAEGPSGFVIGIYKTCAYGGGTTNPDLSHTTKHQLGHAYDLILKGLNGTGHGPSGAPDFINMVNDGLAALTPTNWSTRSGPQKATIVCGIWGSNVNSSGLEQHYGAPSGAVCSSGAINAAYVGLTPSQIAVAVAPYFLDPKEAWAELFAMHLGVQAPPPSPFLQMSDKMFISPNFKCAALDVAKWEDTGAAPTTANLSSSCSAYTTGNLD